MNRARYNFWLDMINLMAFLITTITGFSLWLVFPHKINTIFLGFPRIVWLVTHICFGLVGVVGIVIHIVMHWDWFKALRKRSFSAMPEKLRARRIVNFAMWIAYIATNVSGVIAWMVQCANDDNFVSVFDRLHVVFGIMCTILMILHLAMHLKWLATTTKKLTTNMKLNKECPK